MTHRIFSTSFASVYPMHVQEAERKGRTKDEVDQVNEWLTGYDRKRLQRCLDDERDIRAFFAKAPFRLLSGLIGYVVWESPARANLCHP